MCLISERSDSYVTISLSSIQVNCGRRHVTLCIAECLSNIRDAFKKFLWQTNGQEKWRCWGPATKALQIYTQQLHSLQFHTLE